MTRADIDTIRACLDAVDRLVVEESREVGPVMRAYRVGEAWVVLLLALSRARDVLADMEREDDDAEPDIEAARRRMG